MALALAESLGKGFRTSNDSLILGCQVSDFLLLALLEFLSSAFFLYSSEMLVCLDSKWRTRVVVESGVDNE